jgi:predicted RNA-binding Zn-ribbon protein involved in translation (DUF1610 family)
MLRWLGRIISLASILLAVGASVLSVRAQWRSDTFVCARTWELADDADFAFDSVRVQTHSMAITIEIERLRPTSAPMLHELIERRPIFRVNSYSQPIADDVDAPTSRFYIRREEHRGFAAGSRITTVALPLLVPLGLFLVAPTVQAAYMVRARHRVATHRCRRCGYDMRATPMMCPECGATEAERSKGGRELKVTRK